MGINLLENVKVTRVMNSVAAGTTSQNGTVLDMTGFESVMFIALLGALTATQVTSLKAQQGAQSDGSDAADLTGTKVGPLADSDGNKCLILDLHRPTKQYVRCVLSRGTANAVIDGIIAIQYNGNGGQSQATAAGVAFSEMHRTEIEGTA